MQHQALDAGDEAPRAAQHGHAGFIARRPRGSAKLDPPNSAGPEILGRHGHFADERVDLRCLRIDLKPPEQRPKRFYRGNPVYDAVNVGWVHTDNARKDNGLPLFEYDTSLVGNSNEGHPIAIEDDAERAAVLAYLKTL